MLANRTVLYALIGGLLLIYAGAAWLVLQGQGSHLLVKLAVIILAAHLLEIPLAYSRLKSRNPSVPRLAFMTLVFGLLWWVPASRGQFAVR